MEKIITFSLCALIWFPLLAQGKETFTDPRDGNVYATVQIGSQVWMGENLNFKVESGSWAYDDDLSNTETYGRLYMWEVAMSVCPPGWHLPSEPEWEVLIEHLGGNDDHAGGKMKSSGTEYWWGKNYEGTNSSGFSALPGGKRMIRFKIKEMVESGSFDHIGQKAYFWTSSVVTNGQPGTNGRPYYRFVAYNYSKLFNGLDNKKTGYSVRCVKD